MSDGRKKMGKEKPDVIFPIADARDKAPADYLAILNDFKIRISSTRLKTVMAANSELVLMYWDLGSIILMRQQQDGWGAKVIDRLSKDLVEHFPDMKGFSPRNLKYMRAFAAAWPQKTIVQELLAQLTWYQNIALLEKVKDQDIRIWYAHKVLEFGWSHNILSLQIESGLHKRQGQLINNYQSTLPPQQSDMAHQIFKDPYLFDFLGTADIRRERDLELGLVNHIQKFLLELGEGFAFVGRQVHLELGGHDFYIDLLFYHLKLRCYVVIELKADSLDPGDIGQLNMYMSVVDDILRHETDQQTIGLLLVKQKNRVMAEYCLKGYNKPIGIAEWENVVAKSLPSDLQSSLPSVAEIEAELNKMDN